MQLSPKEARIVQHAIETWEKEGVIAQDQAQTLRNAYEVSFFDWKRLAKYAFWMAIGSLLIALSSVLADRWLIALFNTLFTAPESAKAVVFALCAGGLYALGIQKRRKNPEKTYSNEAVFFLGVVATALSIAFLGKAIDTGSGHFSLLFLLASLVYGALGLWFPSTLVWVFALLSLGSWFGAETGYASGWGAYYLGMNYPMRFVLFGLVLLGLSTYVFGQWKSRASFLFPSRAMGLLYLFLALWILSIFGNYSDPYAWKMARQIELFHWSLLFGAAALGSIYHGLRYDDGLTRGFGITFLFINLYTRFFEYFWDSTHKAIFFSLLAASFWYLGSKAQKIWNLEGFKQVVR